MGQEVSHEGSMGDSNRETIKDKSHTTSRNKQGKGNNKEERKVDNSSETPISSSEASVSFNPPPVVPPTTLTKEPEVTPTRYEGIKDLDEKENWVERATIVTTSDHLAYTETARDIIGEVVDNLPISHQGGITVPKIEVDDTLAEKQEGQGKKEEPQDSAASSDQNLTSDEDFNTPPTTPSKELSQAEDKENNSANQDSIPSVINNKAKLLAKADVNPNDTLDDLADIIGSLSIGPSKSGINAVENKLVDIQVPDISTVREAESLTEVKEVEPKPDILIPDIIVDEIPTSKTKPFLPEDQDTVVTGDVSKSDTFDSGVVEDLDPLASVGNEKSEGDSKVKPDNISDLSVVTEKLPLLDLESEQAKSGEVPILAVDAAEKSIDVPALPTETLLTGDIGVIPTTDAKGEAAPRFEEACEKLVVVDERLISVDVGNDIINKESSVIAKDVISDNLNQLIPTDNFAEIQDLLPSENQTIEDINTKQKASSLSSDISGDTGKAEVVDQAPEIPEAIEVIEPKITEERTLEGQEQQQTETESLVTPDVETQDQKTQEREITENQEGFSGPVDPVNDCAVEKVGIEAPQNPEIPEPEEKTIMEENQAPDSPILSKGAYNIDWDNFDDTMNPFETKLKVTGDFGPPAQSPNKANAASPAKDSKKAAVKPLASSAKKTMGKTSVKNTPPKKEVEDVDPFKSKRALTNSPPPVLKGVEEDIDPFKSNKAIANSPTIKSAPPLDVADEIDPFKSRKGLSNSPPPVAEEVDPFKSRKGLSNSPPVAEFVEEDIDPFKSNKALPNSPTIKSAPPLDVADEIDPFKSRKALSNSPTPVAEEIDPFKSRKALSNSPTPIAEEIDPFKSRKGLSNSPLPLAEFVEEDIDPFKSKKALPNSPTFKSAPPLDVADEIDPFKSRKALSNSPTPVAEEIDPFKSRKGLSNSPLPLAEFVEEDIDPFKSKKALPNSPTFKSAPPLDVADEIDPFKSRKGLSNSPPPVADDVDPFKSKRALGNSPILARKEFSEGIDPFQPGKALANSPPGSPKIEDIDPFKSKRTLANSPPPQSAAPDVGMVNDVISDGQEESAETNNNTTKIQEEPVKKQPPKKKAGTTGKKNIPRKFKPPPKLAQQNDSEDIQIFMPGQKPPPESSKDQPEAAQEAECSSSKPPVAAAAPTEPAVPEMSVSQASNPCSQDSGVDTQSPAEETMEQLNEQEPLGIMEEEFRQASEVFSDPSAWDMLEKFGSSNLNEKESTLSRQSLYVKFDPLVKGDSPAAQKVRSQLLHNKLTGINLVQESDDLLLMSTPPACRDRSQHPAARALADKVGTEGHGKNSLESSNGDMDRMLQCSPYSSSGDNNSSSSSGIPQEMCESREQPYIPELTQSWFETVKSLGDLDGDSAILSTDSLDCVDWVPKECGRPESPLKFDHEEIMRIDTSLNNSNKEKNGNSGVNASKKDTSTPPRPSEPLTDADIVEVLKYSQADVNRMRREWELEKRGTSLIKERDNYEQVQKLTEEKTDLESQNTGLKAKVEDMKDIVAQFEKTMTQLIAEKESSSSASKDSITDLIRERDQAYEDIQSVEAAFGDLHRRYEKTKQTLDGYKKNEDTLKKCVADYQSKLKKQDERYQALKAHAEEKLEQANDEIEKVRKSTETEIARLTVALKRAEMKTSSLDADLERKSKEITELTAICDELISKVGH